MYETIKSSLKSLEHSFMLSSKEVLEDTKKLNTVLDNIDVNNANSKLSNSEVIEITNSIEKLSIKNEYKLNLISDFPEYFYNKNQIKK
tara:strand:+ start:332 stop:595 length:264 start_codon:yes stop_codon:yes gene_type:complete